MNKRLTFTNKTKEAIIAEQKLSRFRLYEEQRYLDGQWLLFTDEPYIEGITKLGTRNLAAEIDEIKAKIADYDNLKTKVEALEKK